MNITGTQQQIVKRFIDPDYWAKIAAGVTFYIPGAYLLDLSLAQGLGIACLFAAGRIAIEADELSPPPQEAERT